MVPETVGAFVHKRSPTALNGPVVAVIKHDATDTKRVSVFTLSKTINIQRATGHVINIDDYANETRPAHAPPIKENRDPPPLDRQ